MTRLRFSMSETDNGAELPTKGQVLMGKTAEVQHHNFLVRYERETKRRDANRVNVRQMGLVNDFVTWNISVVSPKATINEARYLFSRLGVEAMAVYDGQTYLGLLTDQSMEVDAISRGIVNQPTVSDVMRQTIEPTSPDEPVWNAYTRMRKEGIGCLPVLDGKGKLAGLLTRTTVETRFPNCASLANN